MKQEYINNLLSDLAKLDTQLSIEKQKNKNLLSTLKTVKFQLIGYGFDDIDDMEDIEAIKYNIRNAVNYINIILRGNKFEAS